MWLFRQKIVWLTALCCGTCFFVRAQTVHPVQDSSNMVLTLVDGQDTVLWAALPEVDIYADAPRHLKKRVREWTRLRNAVYVTYPYARIAAGVVNEVDHHLDSVSGKHERKIYLKQKEAELKQKFGPKIEDLSIYQGKVLIKLIYRETGTDCYDIIKQMKGGFNARLWQTVAFLFGSNLKTAYNKQENADIESIVEEIESNPYYYNAYYYQYHRRYN